MLSRPSKIYQVGVVLAVGPYDFSDSPSKKMDFPFRIWLLLVFRAVLGLARDLGIDSMGF